MTHPPSRSPGSSELPDPEKLRRRVGCALYGLGMLLGLLLLFVLFIVFPVASGNGLETLRAMFIGALLAFPAALVYLTFPRLLDRYDPEPAYALVMALAWGGVAACGVSALINSAVGAVLGGSLGEAVSTVVSAPLVEEASKGAVVLGYFYFLRREFDGVVDGIIYASFCAIGFAAVENVVYYARAGLEAGPGGVWVTFGMRGVLTPWVHPLYTSMTGLGIGVARETSRGWLRPVAPMVGYGVAVFLHALWNGSALLLGGSLGGFLVFVAMWFLWLLFVTVFVGMVLLLVRRRGRIIRAHLIDEVALGHLTQAELDVAASAFGGVTAYLRKGSQGVEFVRAVARLGLSKWHSARAVKSSTQTVSMDFILPLRRRIHELRAQGASPTRSRGAPRFERSRGP